MVLATLKQSFGTFRNRKMKRVLKDILFKKQVRPGQDVHEKLLCTVVSDSEELIYQCIKTIIKVPGLLV